MMPSLRGTSEILFISRADIADLLTLRESIEAVEYAFKAFAQGATLEPALMHVHAPGGEFHVKSGGLTYLGDSYFGLKANGGFFGNPTLGLPAIQGVIYLADASNGSPLAIMESGHLTVLRTGAATAAAAKRLARPDASIVTICGAGRQGRIQLTALREVLPLQRAWIWDADVSRSNTFGREMSETVGIPVAATEVLHDAASASDVIVTCTPSRSPFLHHADVRPGTFVAAVGADSPDKQEIDVQLTASATVVTDVTAQCALVGELHHALEAGAMRLDQVHAELGQVIAGGRSGRSNSDEIIVYDATGTALQDVICAAVIYRKALEQDRGVRIALVS